VADPQAAPGFLSVADPQAAPGFLSVADSPAAPGFLSVADPPAAPGFLRVSLASSPDPCAVPSRKRFPLPEAVGRALRRSPGPPR